MGGYQADFAGRARFVEAEQYLICYKNLYDVECIYQIIRWVTDLKLFKFSFLISHVCNILLIPQFDMLNH